MPIGLLALHQRTHDMQCTHFVFIYVFICFHLFSFVFIYFHLFSFVFICAAVIIFILPRRNRDLNEDEEKESRAHNYFEKSTVHYHNYNGKSKHYHSNRVNKRRSGWSSSDDSGDEIASDDSRKKAKKECDVRIEEKNGKIHWWVKGTDEMIEEVEKCKFMLPYINYDTNEFDANAFKHKATQYMGNVNKISRSRSKLMDKLKEVDDQMDRLQKKHEEELQSSENMKESIVNGMESVLTEKEKELDETKDELKRIKEEKYSLQDELSDCEDEIERLKKENENMKNKYSDLTETLDRRVNELDELEIKFDDMSEKAEKFEKKYAREKKVADASLLRFFNNYQKLH